ncbi:MAG: SGNH/GDSL hydrolase family protein [Candidatus Omnitrophota bacterium]
MIKKNLIFSAVIFLLLALLIEASSYFILKVLPPQITSEGKALNMLAWESSYTERGLPIPPKGPREGYWGSRIGQKKADPYTGTIEPFVKVPGLLDITDKGYQIAGEEGARAKCRVLIVGASVAFGAYSSDIQHTYFSRIREHLEDEGHSVVLYILASGGWTSNEEMAALRNYGLDIKPDIVVFVNGLNDLVIVKDAGSFPLRLQAINRTIYRPLNGSNTIRLIRSLKDYRAVINFYRRGIIRSSHPPLRPGGRSGVENYLANMAEAKKLAGAHGFKVIYILQPFILEKQRPSFLEKKILNVHSRRFHFWELREDFIRAREGLSSLSDGKTSFFYDCSNALSGERETTFADIWHFSDRGHELFSECSKRAILDAIRDREKED